MLFACCLWGQTNWQEWLQTGHAQFAKHQFVEAKNSFEHAIQIHPQSFEAYRALGLAELELKDYNAAYHAWLKAVDLNNMDEKTKYLLGRLFYEADLPNEAAGWLREALQLAPKDFAATTYLGLSAEALGYDDTALGLYRNAVFESNAQGKPYSWAYLSLGKILQKRGETAPALKAFAEGANKCPEARELTAYGELLASQKQAALAEQVLRQALSLDNSLSQAHYRLALLLKSLGRNEESRVEMSKFQEAKNEEAKNTKITALRR